MKYVLGVDVGTGSVKAVAVNLSGQSFADGQQYYTYNSPKPGYHEQDPELIWQAFKNCLAGIVTKIGTPPLAVSLSSAMHSLIPVDESCKALTPMMTWADNRSAGIANRLKSTNEGMDIYEATGTPLHAMSPLCKIIWIRENNPGLFSRVQKYISIKEFIWFKLFGEFKIDESCASGTGLFNITKRTWHDEALQMAGITIQELSQSVATDYSNNLPGSTPGFTFLKPNTPFFIGASDGCLANLGSMAIEYGIAAVTIGTSGAVRVASNKPLPDRTAMTFNYILDDTIFICGGPINNGGIALQWWLKNNKPELDENDYENFFAEIAAVPVGSSGLIFLPYLTGERAPIWDSESCGTFFNVKLQHNHAHFSRAVLEGICFALKDVLDAVEQNAEPVTQINISGGITRSQLWMQILADITNKKIIMAQSDDASAIGAAFMALKNLRLITKYPPADSSALKIFEPAASNATVYARQFAIYKQLYQNLKGIMHVAAADNP
ncbi:gluconokinase [Mucilaginibacter sp. L3T2-6]|uniref:gluconokinase n=1 Tax=Mucilaginibacter sp. L3T2-6 TaxID=3062491 RepID=UPI002676166F|nr:gluconokinase [Mucilaginibacter sp. L3T2-6]MDO3643430.1 gluconokinase [Mucilaginibacter sp. L3T2-6]MDV6215637.1 gluconokinase [Mucilaginibacter sp. L3T2-6]